MTPNEKAEYLINSFLYIQNENFGIEYATLCAINCVNEMLLELEEFTDEFGYAESRVIFLNEVKEILQQ